MENPRQYLSCSKCQWDHCRGILLVASTSCASQEPRLHSSSPLFAFPSIAALSGFGAGRGATWQQETAWGSNSGSVPHRAAVQEPQSSVWAYSSGDTQMPLNMLTGQAFHRKFGANCNWCWLLNTMRHTEKSGALKACGFRFSSGFTFHHTPGWFLTN